MKPLQFKGYALAILTASLLFSQLGFAEKIYKWKDENGKTHFTNNIALVPIQSEDTEIIKMKALPVPVPVEEPIDGKALWDNLCASCHIMSATSNPDFRGMRKLVDNINDPSTPPETDAPILQAALDDEMDDAAKINLSPEEVQAITAFIRKQLILNISFPTSNDKKQEKP